MEICGDGVDVWAVDSCVVDGAVEVCFFEEAEVVGVGGCGPDMDHDALVFDFVEVDGALEGCSVGDDGVGGGVLGTAGHSWDGDGADDADDDDDDDQFDEGEGGSSVVIGRGWMALWVHMTWIG